MDPAPDWKEENPMKVEDFKPDERLAAYWDVLVKGRLLIAGCTAVAVLLALLLCLISKPTYKATVVLDIGKEKASPFDIGSVQAGYAPYDPEYVPTQIRLMSSREVAERVVQKMKLTGNKAVAPGEGLLSRWRGVRATGRNSAGQLVTDTAIAVQENVEAAHIRRTNLVELSYVGASPKLAAAIANALANAYIDWTLESKLMVVKHASKFLTSQIEQLKNEIAKKDGELQSYSKQKDIISVDPQNNVTLQKLEALNRDYAAAVTDRIATEARFREFQNGSAVSIADSLSNGFVSQLRNDQAKLEREYAEKLNLYKPQWPAMQQLKAQIDKGRQNLNSVIQETVGKARDISRTDYLTAQRREEALSGVLKGQKGEAMVLNSDAIEYNNLKVEVETKRALLDELLKRQAETSVMSGLSGERISNIRVVDRALSPPSRFRPSVMRYTALALLAGLALGIAVTLSIELLDRRLRSLEQVEQFLRVPALGIIPASGAGKKTRGIRSIAGGTARGIELVPHEQPRSIGAEAYRSFRTSLLLSRAGGVHSIAITSAFPSEGKTSTSVNLAIVLGQLGKRVLLIDADLHRPRIHSVLRISNRVGLVSILAENLAPSAAITTTAMPGLSVLPSGPSTPNPSGLLSSSAMTTLLEFARQNFDFVVLDTPPVSPVADAMLLGHQADGVVICIDSEKTAREHVARVRDQLTRSGVTILGALLNNVDVTDRAGSHYAAYYGAPEPDAKDVLQSVAS